MRAKTVYEFVRGRDPKETLSLGRVGSIRKFFRDLDIPDDKYEITETEVIFKGYLDLEGTPITELPEGLSVGGGLDLSGTPITELPERLSIGGNLYLSNTSISELPEGLSIGGSLYLFGTAITELPERLNIGGYLDLRKTTITELPERLSVGQNIYINESQIQLKAYIQSSKFANKLRIGA